MRLTVLLGAGLVALATTGQSVMGQDSTTADRPERDRSRRPRVWHFEHFPLERWTSPRFGPQAWNRFYPRSRIVMPREFGRDLLWRNDRAGWYRDWARQRARWQAQALLQRARWNREALRWRGDWRPDVRIRVSRRYRTI